MYAGPTWQVSGEWWEGQGCKLGLFVIRVCPCPPAPNGQAAEGASLQHLGVCKG